MGQTGFHKENDRLFFKARRRRKFLMIWGAEYQDSCIFGQGMKGFRRLRPREGRDNVGRDRDEISNVGRDVPSVPPFKGGTRKLCPTGSQPGLKGRRPGPGRGE